MSKAIAWDYAKHYSRPIPGIKMNEAELRIDYPNQGRLQLFGSDNPDSLRGLYHDMVVLDEYAQMSPSLWGEIIRPALSDRMGDAIFIGTPKGRNSFYEIYQYALKDEGWFAGFYKASDTNIINPLELAAAKKEMKEEEYNQEYELSWTASILGAYYGKTMAELDKKGRITHISYDPNYPVHTTWDIGVSDSTSIWFYQIKGNEVFFIDYFEDNRQGVEYYKKKLDEREYTYGVHTGPHDLEVTEWGTNKTRIETAANLGLHFVVAPKISVLDGISTTRSMLKRSHFDKERCAFGIEALTNYHSEYDDKKKIFKATPQHDWSSHCCDSMRYAAVNEDVVTNMTAFGEDFSELFKEQDCAWIT
jgi:hypothetical protein